MKIYKQRAEALTLIKEVKFKLEKEIQELCEQNLELLFGLELVKSEFQLNRLRIDTLAFDKESNSFVVVEYKRNTSFSVVDQGYAYLALLLNNKADFVLELNERAERNYRKKDIDWSQVRVVFVAPNFTTYQQEAINFKNLPIELWQIKKFSNETISFNRLNSGTKEEQLPSSAMPSEANEKVASEVKVYSEADLLQAASDDTKELYQIIKEHILELADLEVIPKKHYVNFSGVQIVCRIHVQKRALKLWLNLKIGRLEDPKNLAEDVSNKGHLGKGDYQLHLTNTDDIQYLLYLIKQSVEVNA